MEENGNKDTHVVQKQGQRHSVKEFFKVNEALGYFFRGKDASRPNNFNIRMMHGINKISIVIFLLGVIFIILKHVL